MSDTTNQTQAPPYVTWGTFRNFISGLREHGLPTQINRSVMSNLSFSAQAQLMAALKSLSLTDAKGTPTPILAELVGAGESDQGEVLKRILHSGYSFVFKELDLSRATPGELEAQFKAAGISGSTVGRAVGFFLGAANSAGIPLSPHIKKNGSPSSSVSRPTRRRRRIATGQKVQEDDLPPPPPPASQTEKTFEGGLLSKFPEFDPKWPDDLKKSWFEGFKTLMEMAPNKKPEA